MTEHIAYCVAKWVNGKRQHWNKVISDVIKFPFVEEMYTITTTYSRGGEKNKTTYNSNNNIKSEYCIAILAR